jgi:hypothetical protein
MLRYFDGTEVHVGDHVRHATADAVVETVIEGEEIARWGVESPGFMLLCDHCGHVFIEPGSYDWEDVVPMGPAASP